MVRVLLAITVVLSAFCMCAFDDADVYFRPTTNWVIHTNESTPQQGEYVLSYRGLLTPDTPSVEIYLHRYEVTDDGEILGLSTGDRWFWAMSTGDVIWFETADEFNAVLAVGGLSIDDFDFDTVSRFDDPFHQKGLLFAVVFWLSLFASIVLERRRIRQLDKGQAQGIPQCRGCGHFLNPLGEVCPECGIQLQYPAGLNVLQKAIPFIIAGVLLYALIHNAL